MTVFHSHRQLKVRLGEAGNALQRIRELAIQSANSTNSVSDRTALNAEATQLLSEIQRNATTTSFNGQKILDGTFSTAQFQVGAEANQTISFGIAGATTDLLGAFQATSANVTTTAFDGANLSINGTAVGASVSTTAAGVTSGSGAAKATAINSVTNTTGVTATATTTLDTSDGNVAPIPGQALANGDLVINGVAVGSIAAGTTAVEQANTVVTAINAVSNQTNVTAAASQSTGILTLTSSEGRDITISAGNAASTQIVTDVYNATGLDAILVQSTGNIVRTITFRYATL